MKLRIAALALLLVCGPRLHLPAAEAGLSSQLSGWFSLNDDSPSTPRFGVRWQPSLSLAMPLGGEWKLDGEFSLDAAASGAAPGWNSPDIDGGIDPYRLWLRLSSRRFEARLGLQKINFGSAAVFRPLMWFDRIDARDPLQLTSGVYGLLLRYYFKGDANLWLWGLYGNDDPKGWETLPTAARTPELGGRLQVPLFSGEAAATAHFRRVDGGAGSASESRFALDGKWDVGVGLWVEASAARRDDRAAALPWQRSLALGVDYTFALGNGLYLLVEQYLSAEAAEFAGAGASGASLSALVARYPVSLLDALGGILYYDWRNRRLYAFASWQRTLDHWQFHVMAFANPAKAPGLGGSSASAMFSGIGLQLLAAWSI